MATGFKTQIIDGKRMRLIDADALEKDIRELLFTEEDPSRLLTEAGQMIFNSAIEVALFEVVEAETIDAEPVVHARWLYDRPQHYKCSACKSMWGELMKRVAHFCPSCGAKMEGCAEG